MDEKWQSEPEIEKFVAKTTETAIIGQQASAAVPTVCMEFPRLSAATVNS